VEAEGGEIAEQEEELVEEVMDLLDQRVHVELEELEELAHQRLLVDTL